MKDSHFNPKRLSSPVETDSLFGLALGQVFMTATFGIGAGLAFDAVEVGSAVRMDRAKPKPAPSPQHKNGLKTIFETAPQTMAEQDAAFYKPLWAAMPCNDGPRLACA